MDNPVLSNTFEQSSITFLTFVCKERELLLIKLFGFVKTSVKFQEISKDE